jgi:hypothetical protein
MNGEQIEFVGVVCRTKDGTTVAMDLSSADLNLTLNVNVPVAHDDDVTQFGQIDWALPLERVQIEIDGKRHLRGSKLLTYRIVKDGEAPFPAWERAE